MGGIGVPELVVILAILLLLFGAKKLPGLAGSIGTSLKEFRKAAEEADGDGSGDGTSRSETDTSPPPDRDGDN